MGSTHSPERLRARTMRAGIIALLLLADSVTASSFFIYEGNSKTKLSAELLDIAGSQRMNARYLGYAIASAQGTVSRSQKIRNLKKAGQILEKMQSNHQRLLAKDAWGSLSANTNSQVMAIYKENPVQQNQKFEALKISVRAILADGERAVVEKRALSLTEFGQFRSAAENFVRGQQTTVRTYVKIANKMEQNKLLLLFTVAALQLLTLVSIGYFLLRPFAANLATKSRKFR